MDWYKIVLQNGDLIPMEKILWYQTPSSDRAIRFAQRLVMRSDCYVSALIRSQDQSWQNPQRCVVECFKMNPVDHKEFAQ